MKNAFALSLLCATLAIVSMQGIEAGEALFSQFLCAQLRQELNDTLDVHICKIESFGGDGRIQALIEANPFNGALKVGNTIGRVGSSIFYIASIEPSEDPAYLRIMLLADISASYSEAEQEADAQFVNALLSK